MGNSNEINVCIYLIGDLLNEIMILANWGKIVCNLCSLSLCEDNPWQDFLQSLISFKIGWLLLF